MKFKTKIIILTVRIGRWLHILKAKQRDKNLTKLFCMQKPKESQFFKYWLKTKKLLNKHFSWLVSQQKGTVPNNRITQKWICHLGINAIKLCFRCRFFAWIAVNWQKSAKNKPKSRKKFWKPIRFKKAKFLKFKERSYQPWWRLRWRLRWRWYPAF